jgi:hypothetical protein
MRKESRIVLNEPSTQKHTALHKFFVCFSSQSVIFERRHREMEEEEMPIY